MTDWRRSWSAAAGLFVFTLIGGGCPAEVEQSLVDHGLWDSSEADDPWPEHRPTTTDCSTLAWSEEVDADGSSLEIDTGACDYLVLTQGSLEDVSAGDGVTVGMRHGELEAAGPAEAHVGVVLDGWVLLDEAVSIPASERDWNLTTAAQQDVSEGARIVFHLHNHGANTWNLDSLTVMAVD